MAKVRAYKLAEELGIDRAEFVEKAKSHGIELRSPMSSLDEDQVELLRERLGGRKDKGQVTEKRVERKGGAAVIRRRKKAAPKPEPPPEAEAPPVSAEPATAVEEEPGPETVAEPEPAAAEPEEAPEPTPTPTPAPAAPRPAPNEPAAPAEARGPGGSKAPPDKAGRQRKLVREVVNLREQERLARQATGRSMMRRQITIDPRAMSSPRRRRRDAPAPKAVPGKSSKESGRSLRIEGGVAVGELARMMGVKAPEVQKRLMALGTMASINQAIDAETAGKVAHEFGYEVEDVGFREEAFFDEPAKVDEDKLKPRPPVITVMGHVDHGKTSLLDALRRTDVVAGEAGGITQHIGAYQVTVDGKRLTFIDTPGHAAFTAMRARGAQVTDIVILVVAASEGVMPQTVEAIDHAKAAGVPIVVAINKIDLPGANPQQTRQRLMEHDLVPEEFGGDIICVEVSALKGIGLDKLLEMLALQSELLELKADPARRASGVVLEARLDKGRGALATVLVREGTLRRGDNLVVGTCTGRVRAMEDEHGKRVKEAGPATPVQVIGLSGVPEAGQEARVVENDRAAKEIVDHRLAERRAQPAEGPRRVSLDEFFADSEDGGIKELRIVLKADVHGSVEAVRDALLKLSTDAVKVDVIHAGVGAVSETDVMLAKASEALIVGFGVRPDPAARKEAEGQGVEIQSYRVIYELTDYVRQRMTGLLPPTETEKILGRAEVRQTFNVPRVGTIAGCYMSDGVARRNAMCRLLRDGVEVYSGRVGSLRRFKDDVREVSSGFECGIGIEGYNDVKIGDVIEIFEIERKAPTLE
jgi:translation initiation factor IF-2